ncbi:hypothetical protein [Crossiella cryophila]|uniref:Uncharacterized protein n=1 Tax=Crossiella cryophila TaxID=43355 RepID=A0A7W7CHA2_9PSEU|nr:hypothetical protein [Crossiella cryophila]MBB4679728.1 hypothetical protein [Crossiella cryophila]
MRAILTAGLVGLALLSTAGAAIAAEQADKADTRTFVGVDRGFNEKEAKDRAFLMARFYARANGFRAEQCQEVSSTAYRINITFWEGNSRLVCTRP